jgi:hypothetical protein
MNLDFNHLLGQAVFFAFVLWIIYRRFRRLFGRQKLNRGWMIFRVVLFSVLGAFMFIPAIASQQFGIALVLGAAIGVGLGMWGAKRTRFEARDGVLYYIPHTYTGMVVSALFLGRIVYRIATGSYSAFSVATTDSSPFAGMGGLGRNPLTYGLFCVLLGYYIYYYGYVLYESKHLKPGDMEDAAEKDGTAGNI